MRAIDFEEGFLGELALMGQVGNLGAALGPDTRAECRKAGGTWNAKAKLCAMPGATPGPGPVAVNPTRAEKRETAQDTRQADREAQQLANRKAACLRQGGTWLALNGTCVPKSKPVGTKSLEAQCEAGGGVWFPGVKKCVSAADVSACAQKGGTTLRAECVLPKETTKDLKADCLKRGGRWNAAKKTCDVQVIEGKPVAYDPTNAAMCKAQGGTWFPGVKKCVLADVLAACTAQGGTMFRGQCKMPEAVAAKPAKPVPPKQACVNAGGQWFAAQRLCMTAEQLAACTSQGGTAFKGQCRLPAPVSVVRPGAQPVPGTGAPAMNTRKACRAAGGTWKRNQCQIGAPYVAPMPTPTVQPCPSGYQLSPDGQSCYPTTGVQQPPLTQEPWYTQPPITQPESQPGAAPTLPGFPGYGGEGPGASGPSGAPGAPYFDSAGMQPDQLVEGGGAGAPGAGAGNECSEGFNGTLPQEYEDEFGKMVVLQVFCKQAAAQQASAFTSFSDQSQAEVISGSFGPMGTRPISAVEAEEMGSAAPAGGEGGGFSGLGW